MIYTDSQGTRSRKTAPRIEDRGARIAEKGAANSRDPGLWASAHRFYLSGSPNEFILISLRCVGASPFAIAAPFSIFINSNGQNNSEAYNESKIYLDICLKNLYFQLGNI